MIELNIEKYLHINEYEKKFFKLKNIKFIVMMSKF